MDFILYRRDTATPCPYTHYTFLFLLFLWLFTMSTLMPLIKHRRDSTFMPAVPPRTPMPSPAWTPEEEAQGKEQEEECQERTEAAEAKSPWAMERHPISIIWIRHGRGLARRRLDGNRRSLGNPSLKSEEGNACHRGNQ